MKLSPSQSWVGILSIIPIAFIFFLFTSTAQANPMHMNMHHGHIFKPHNAAVHFLAMARPLQLTDKQIGHLITLRDAWIEKNSVKEAKLSAMRSDLQRLMMADSINLKAADQTLANIGELESGLWRAFVRQLHDIKAILSAKQKQRLSEMHRMKMGRAMAQRKMKH